MKFIGLLSTLIRMRSGILSIIVVLHNFMFHGECILLEKCSNNAKCNGGKVVKCAICAYSMEASMNLCLRPFNNLYYDTPGTCKRNIDHCGKEKCYEDTTVRAVEGYGICMCECKSRHRGNACDYEEVNEMFTSGVQMLVLPIIHEDTFMTVFVTALRGGPKTMVEVTSHDGNVYLSTDKSVVTKKSSTAEDVAYCMTRIKDDFICNYFSVKVEAAYEMRLKLPFHAVRDKLVVIRFRDAALGYLTKLVANVYNDRLLVTRLSQTVLVTYHAPLPCVPSVHIKNCETNYWNRRKRLESFDLEFKSDIAVVRDGANRADSSFLEDEGCPEPHSYTWEAWRIVPNLDVETTPPDIYSNTSTKTWKFTPYSLAPDIYMIRLTVTSETKNFAKCYLEIIDESAKPVRRGNKVFYKPEVDSESTTSNQQSHHKHRRRRKKKISYYHHGTDEHCSSGSPKWNNRNQTHSFRPFNPLDYNLKTNCKNC